MSSNRTAKAKPTPLREKEWKATFDAPPGREALLRAALVMFGLPPIIHPTVLARIRREEAEKAEAEKKEGGKK